MVCKWGENAVRARDGKQCAHSADRWEKKGKRPSSAGEVAAAVVDEAGCFGRHADAALAQEYLAAATAQLLAVMGDLLGIMGMPVAAGVGDEDATRRQQRLIPERDQLADFGAAIGVAEIGPQASFCGDSGRGQGIPPADAAVEDAVDA